MRRQSGANLLIIGAADDPAMATMAAALISLAAQVPASYVAFALLALGDDDLRALPQHERRSRLEAALAGVAPPVHLTPATREMHREFALLFAENVNVETRTRAECTAILAIREKTPEQERRIERNRCQ